MARPSDHPPPFSPEEAAGPPTDPADERIDVGVLIVGGGPAGLACAIRLGQLVEERPELAERLGEVPIAVVDKGAKPGAHLLSGAVVDPVSLRRLFHGRVKTDEMGFAGPVHGEAVYFMTRTKALRIPAPPSMWNHGNWIGSLSRIGRFMAEQAEELGVTFLPETSADRLLVQDGRVVGVRTGDRGRGKNGEELPRFEAGSDLVARATVLAEGTQGHLTGVALDRFDLASDQPQVWALGVKELWRVAKPLDSIVHTMGWPLRPGKRYREFGGSFIYPLGESMVSIGMVVGLDYTDVELSAHDLLQELKTHPLVRKILKGGERVGWGAKTIPEGGLQALPKRLHGPGFAILGDAAGLVNVPALKGVHYAVESGILAAEAIADALGRGEATGRPDAFAGYTKAVRDSYIWKDLWRARNMRPGFAGGFAKGAAIAGAATNSLGFLPPGNLPTHRDADSELIRTGRATRYPKPDNKLTFDKLSSVFLSGNKSRDDAPSHIRIETRVPRDVAEMWVNMCPAQVYELGREDAGKVEVLVTPSNCVQCGAITAKGGRLTPAEGGSGPEYTLT